MSEPQIPRIGVYICHCGLNIAGRVNVEELVKYAKSLDNVVVARDYKFMCSAPGQDFIKNDIQELKLDRMVVAACTPTMHGLTFGKACEKADLNRYLFEMANIREHCSWVSLDSGASTEQAKLILARAVFRVWEHKPLTIKEFPVNSNVLVLGAGICGITAALKVADAGYKVYLVEKEPSIGGHMAKFDKTFPTLDCAACILTPKMVQIAQHPNITLLANSELTGFSGFIGNFTATIRKRTRYIDEEKCTGCGECVKVCPIMLPSEFEHGLVQRPAVYRQFPQAVPHIFSISKRNGIPLCKATCPVGVNVQGYVALIAKGKFEEALQLVKEHNPFPGICGRVCHHPCEDQCRRKDIDEPVAIASLKRFVADYEMSLNKPILPKAAIKNGHKVAVVGSGPAGLTAAYDLAVQGFGVVLFEELPEAGGMLRYGIPAFRLPRDIIQKEIQAIEAEGVEIRTNHQIRGLNALTDYDAVLLAIGAHKSKVLGIPGENYQSVINCIDFLRNINLGKSAGELGKVAVIGGGNAAIDSARTALRIGAKSVTIVYRRTRQEMPAISHEVDEAELEGVKIIYLAAPIEVMGENGRVAQMRCRVMELGEPDESGRRRPVPTTEEFTLAVDTVINAVGQEPDISPFAKEEIKSTRWATFEVDPTNLTTSKRGIVAAGDAVSGPATVIEAIASGHKAAKAIDAYFHSEKKFWGKSLIIDLEKEEKPTEIAKAELPSKKTYRVRIPSLPQKDRLNTFNQVELGFSLQQAIEEAKRCLDCGICSECMECVKVCEAKAINHGLRDQIIEVGVGSIIVTTGFETFNPAPLGQYGYGKYPNVVTSLELERILNAAGPTEGELLTKEGKVPESVAILHCVGSRDENYNKYCSRVCCMYSLKLAHLVREKTPRAKVYELYIDMRSPGKGYEEFFERVQKEGVYFIRGKGAEVTDFAEFDEEKAKLIVKCEDTLAGVQRRIPAEMVILSIGLNARGDSRDLAKLLNLSRDKDGFFIERHLKLDPIATPTDGIFVAGCCSGPKDITDTVSQGLGAASEVISLNNRGKVEIEPITSWIDPEKCAGCRSCISVCKSGAITFDKEKKISVVNEALCKGCGTCVVACPGNVITQNHYTDAQVLAELRGILSNNKIKPFVIVFVCNWCSGAAADLAGTSRLKYPANVAIIKVMCSGRVGTELALEAFRQGADGVLVTGCHFGDCRYGGNYKTFARSLLLEEFLQKMGIEDGRYRREWIGAPEAKLFADAINVMVKHIKGLEKLKKVEEEQALVA